MIWFCSILYALNFYVWSQSVLYFIESRHGNVNYVVIQLFFNVNANFTEVSRKLGDCRYILLIYCKNADLRLVLLLMLWFISVMARFSF